MYLSVLHRDSDCSNNDAKPSSTKNISSRIIDSVNVLLVEGNIFNWAFTPEEHFMINLCNVCEESNAPLDLVDNVVAVIHDAQNNGLNMESNVVCSREYFLKHLNKRANHQHKFDNFFVPSYASNL